MGEHKVKSINKNKDYLKEFCLLCGKYTNELKDVSTISNGKQILMMKMCQSCEVVVHNFMRMIDQAIKAEVAKQQERRIILP